MRTFPKGFLWSASTSAYQVEGAAYEGGKTASIVDNNINPTYADTTITSDHYHRWEEDVELMHELGLTAYRFSISWPRILPDGHTINPEGIAFYRKLIDKLEAYNIEPMVTLYHFDLPQCLQDAYGGWRSRQVVDDFERFVRVVFDAFGNDVKIWFTINEQSNLFALPYLMVFNDVENKQFQKYQMNHHMMLAHAKAVELCKQRFPHSKIGPAIGVSPHYPASMDPLDVLAAQHADDFFTYFFTDLYVHGTYHPKIQNYLDSIGIRLDIRDEDATLLQRGKPDFIALNYYISKAARYCSSDSSYREIQVNAIGENGLSVTERLPGYYEIVDNPTVPTNPWGWVIDPVGLRIQLNQIYNRYRLPIMITENGLGIVEELNEQMSVDDHERIKYINDHLAQCRLAIEDGVELLGYSPWSLLDVLSTTSGFRKRYGFIYVDRTDHESKTLNRYKKKSFYWYSRVIHSNGEIIDID